MTSPADTQPPYDLQAEESVVAALMVDAEAYERVADTVSGADFHDDRARWTFEACRELWLRGESVNEVTVAHELARGGKITDVGGPAYLARVVSDLPTPVGVEHYAAIVHRDAKWRALITVGQRAVQVAYAGGPDFDAGVAQIDGMLTSLATGHEASSFRSIRQLLDEFWEDLDDTPTARGMVVRTGLPDLDALLAGLHPGNLVIVAARPGVGKSAFMLQITRNAVVGQGAKVATITLEMSDAECRSRLLAMETGIDSKRIRQRAIVSHLTEDEERRLSAASGDMAPWPLEVRDRAVSDVEKLRMELRKVAHKLGGLDLVVVDYLQLIAPRRRGENRTQEVSELSRGLKLMAKELGVPVIAASQLNRDVEKRPGAEPKLSDLRESGSIEQDADVVLFLHRADRVWTREQWERDTPVVPYPAGWVSIIVAKHRSGPLGTVRVKTDDPTSRFWCPTDFAAPDMEPLL